MTNTFRMLFYLLAIFAIDGEKKISLSEYNKLLDRFKTLNSRTQQLELNEYKRNNPGYISLLNNATTAYKLIDDMLKFKPDATWEELFDNDNPVDSVCIETEYTLSEKTKECLRSEWYGNCPVSNPDCIDIHTRCCEWKYNNFKFSSYNMLKQKYHSFMIPGHRGDFDSSKFSITTRCKEMVSFAQSNIKGYVEYKHAYNANDKQWLKQVIQQIIDENKSYHFEDVVSEFRKRYYRIYEDDKRIYKFINQQLV